MSPRYAAAILAAVCLGLAGLTLHLDLAELSDGRFWGDGATYYAMAWSLAEDLDIEYEARDVYRVRREFADGPQGIFLKRASGGFVPDFDSGFPWLRRLSSKERRIYFAKPFLYPVVAAPLVRAFGTRGLLLTNALGIGMALCFGYAALRVKVAPGQALMATAALILGTVAPLYLVWPAPEALSLGLAAAGLLAWRRGWVLVAAALIGISTYGKPPNLLLAIPLGLDPLFDRGRSLVGRFGESVRRGVSVLVCAGLLYGANWAVTGEWNYQGGAERKTFYGRFPFESPGVTFGNSGIWMSTNQFGPRIEGRDEVATSQGSEPPRSFQEIRTSFLWNVPYFWIGRFGGVVPYFLPFAVATLLFLALGPRDRAGWLVLAALLVSEAIYTWKIPDNWYGGSGTLGNRYFLNLLPLAFFLVPRGREAIVAASGLVSAALFTGPLLMAPMHHALDPGDHAKGWPFRLFPAELTMLNDLAVFAEPWRKKVPFGDPYGDPKKPGSADPASYFLYFPDNGTFGKERGEGGDGFWVRGGASAEVFLRALEPVRRATFFVTGGPVGDLLEVSVGGRRATLDCAPGQTRSLSLEPEAGFPYKDTFVYVVRLRSTRGGGGERPAADTSERVLGAFVRISLEVTVRGGGGS